MLAKQLLLLFLLVSTLSAVDGKVKAFIKSDKTVYTSQKITVSVELLSNAFSITDARIRFPSSDSYIVQEPKSAAYIGKEEIGDEDWQMVHYEYELYALRAGKLEIAPIPASFTASMGYGQPKKSFDLQSDKLTFEVKAPKGAKEDQFVLVTDNYQVTSKRQPESGQLIIGDAVTMTVTQQANGVPDILLPPIRYRSNALVRVYDKEPELKSGLKGDFDVSRRDRFTFVAAQEGNVSLPAKELLWWDSKTEKIKRETIPAATFEIIPDPQIAIDARKAVQKKFLMILAAAAIVLAILSWLLYPRIKHYLHQQKIAFEASEKGRFEALLQALKSGDISKSYTLFYEWILTIDPELADDGFRGIREKYPSFGASLQLFENALSDSVQVFDTKVFASDLKRFRKMVSEVKKSKSGPLPKALNP